MLLKIGELAKRTGLTVRALHHYDAIGLLSPSARSPAGYRLYERADLARLHQVQALRKFGLPLADIALFLAGPGRSLGELLEQQMDMLERQIEQAAALRARLARLQADLARGQEPDLADWLTTLEHMAMYDKYFTPQELARLPLYHAPAQRADQWKTLVAKVRALIDSGAAPELPPARALATEWMEMVKCDTAADSSLLAKLNVMHQQEALVQERTGISMAMMDYVLRAARANALAIYRQYLNDAEFAYLEDNYSKRSAEWVPLIARYREALDAGAAPSAPSVQTLARHWLELFRSYAGDDPRTQAKFRQAHECEPSLTSPWIAPALLAFIRASLAALAPRPD
ncbi:MAG: MerR family transcriptional regulator [Pseudomonadota bacterium]